jgi:hypothetical protein
MENTIAENKFVSLSYESYLDDVLKSFKSIKQTDNQILSMTTKFEDKLSLMKKQYHQLSLEDGTETKKNEVKIKFGDSIKNWFIRVWTFLCDIFTKIYEIIVSLIKSLIIFIQKKKLQAHSIIKLIEKKGLTGFNVENNDIIKQMLKSNAKIKFLDYKTDVNQAKFRMGGLYYNYINARLTDNDLKTFINNSIILKNPNSIFSTDTLQKYIKTDILKNDISEDNKLSTLENSVDQLYGEAIFANEVDPVHRNMTNPLIAKYKDLIASKDITKLAHNIVFGMDKPNFIDMPIIEFFGLKAGAYDINVESLKDAFHQYYEDTQLVISDNGYIHILEETLKKYKEQAKKDHANIKEMQKTVLNYLNTIGSKGENGEKIQYRCKRFTNIVLKVKNIKTHFIRLRQTVILDIITLFDIENQAWYKITGKGGLLKDSFGFKDDAKFDNEPIISLRHEYDSQPGDE